MGACSAVCHGTSGHQRSVGGACTRKSCPSRGEVMLTPSCFAATCERSMGSVQEWFASVTSPQCTGIINRPRTSRCASTACSGPRCQSGQPAPYCPASIIVRSKGPSFAPISSIAGNRPVSPE
ncbi:hypothetical protein COSO111634_24470 [Corallococcus soli]